MDKDFLLGMGLTEEQTERVLKEHDGRIDALRFDAALKEGIEETKPRSFKAVKALLDMEGLSLVDGKIGGLAEQLGRLKQEHDYLFEPALATGAGFLDPPERKSPDAEKINRVFGFTD